MSNKNNLQGVGSVANRLRLLLDRMIRSRNTLAIGLVTAMLIIAFAVKSNYSLGSCQKQSAISFLDESGGRDYKFSTITTNQTSFFKTYVTNISKYFFIKIDEIAQCKGNMNSDPQIELVFVYRPLFVDKEYRTAPFKFERIQADETSYLDSPWVKLSLTRSPKLVVRAAFIWNERQFLLDQALLSGARADPNVQLLPLDREIFKQLLREYEKEAARTPSSSKDVKSAISADLVKRIPTDLIWLFLNSGNFDGNVEAVYAKDIVIGQRLARYIDLNEQLLNHRLASPLTEQHYSSVLALEDVFKADTYRIDRIRL